MFDKAINNLLFICAVTVQVITGFPPMLYKKPKEKALATRKLLRYTKINRKKYYELS